MNDNADEGLRHVWEKGADGIWRPMHPCNNDIDQTFVPRRPGTNFSLNDALPIGEEAYHEGGWIRVGQGIDRVPLEVHGWPQMRKDLDAEALRSEYDDLMGVWKGSDCRKHLHEILAGQQPPQGWQIEEAICLGTGSWSRSHEQTPQGAFYAKRSMIQLVMFMDTVAYLQASNRSSLRIFAQEFKYTPLDWEFLATLGVTVIKVPTRDGENAYDGPDAVNLIGGSSFICEFCIEHNYRFIKRLLDVEPGLVIGSMWTTDEEIDEHQAWISHPRFGNTLQTALPHIGVSREFANKHVAEAMPQFEEDETGSLTSLSIFSNRVAPKGPLPKSGGDPDCDKPPGPSKRTLRPSKGAFNGRCGMIKCVLS